MIIECAHCHARYKYDEARFEGKPAKKIRCAKCREVSEIRNPVFQDRPRPKMTDGDSTITSRPDSRPKPPPLDPDSEGSPRSEDDSEEGPLRIPASVLERQKLDAPKLPANKRLSLAIIDGPDSGRVFRIDKAYTVIGRTGADVVLNDAESSRAHAALEVHEDLIVLEDLGSTNGTFFEYERLVEPVIVQNHSEFVIGETTLMLIVTPGTG